VSYGAPIHGLGPNGEPMAPRAIGGLNELAAAVHLTAMKKGWWGDIRDYLPDTEESPAGPSMRGHGRNFTEVLALIHSEVSETLEEYRSGSLMDQVLWEHKDGTRCIGTTPCVEDNNAKPVGIPIEMADILIRVLDACAAWEIDIDTALQIKAAYNESRPHRHGGKLA
jgi:hypothetical protein